MSYKTQEEKAKEINAYCDERDKFEKPCEGCPLEKPCSLCYGDFESKESFIACLEAYDILQADKPIEVIEEVPTFEFDTVVQHDPVNHPKHYCREGAMECIDEMVLIFGKEAVKTFCLLNSWKYRYRAADKNGEEDMKKSDFYIRKFKELNDGCI